MPFDWKNDFSEEYLPSIRYICLAMTDTYIDAHFAEIKNHASDIEQRLDDSYCTPALMKRDNRKFREGCAQSGNSVTLIEDSYERVIEKVLEQGDKWHESSVS